MSLYKNDAQKVTFESFKLHQKILSARIIIKKKKPAE